MHAVSGPDGTAPQWLYARLQLQNMEDMSRGKIIA